MSLGNRELLTPEEVEDREFAKELDASIDAGDPNWLSKVSEYLGDSDGDLFEIPIDDAFRAEVDKEQTSRGL